MGECVSKLGMGGIAEKSAIKGENLDGGGFGQNHPQPLLGKEGRKKDFGELPFCEAWFGKERMLDLCTQGSSL